MSSDVSEDLKSPRIGKSDLMDRSVLTTERR